MPAVSRHPTALHVEALAQLPASIPELLARADELIPEREAVVGPDGRASYRDLRARSDSVARALVACGIARGAHVAICLGNSVEWAALFYGILRVGAVCVPINTRLKANEIAYQLAQSKAQLLFLADKLLGIDFIEMLRAICPEIDRQLPGASLPHLARIVVCGRTVPAGCTPIDAFIAAGASARLPRYPDATDSALIQYTSGTTSHPKGAVLAHKSMVLDAFCAGTRMGLRGEDRYLSARPFFHVAGSTLSVVLACARQATLVTMMRFTGDDALRLLVDERCTMTSGNDTMYLMMLGSPAFRRGAYALRGGWAAVSPGIMRRIVEELEAAQTVTAYGLSEASPNVVMSDHGDPLEDRIEGWMRPHPGLEVRVVDPETERDQPAGEPGEIRVRGWCLMKGYHDSPVETAKAFTSDGYLKTGDLGVLAPDGRLKFIGRLKDSVRVGGENVAPSEIEDVLNQHPKVRMAQVFALPDPRLIEVPGAYVVARDGETLEVSELIEWATPRLASFKMPRHIAVIESFDIVGMTASSKVPKRLLIEHAKRYFNLEEAG